MSVISERRRQPSTVRVNSCSPGRNGRARPPKGAPAFPLEVPSDRQLSGQRCRFPVTGELTAVDSTSSE
jgi:hypothetical protein